MHFNSRESPIQLHDYNIVFLLKDHRLPWCIPGDPGSFSFFVIARDIFFGISISFLNSISPNRMYGWRVSSISLVTNSIRRLRVFLLSEEKGRFHKHLVAIIGEKSFETSREDWSGTSFGSCDLPHYDVAGGCSHAALMYA